MKEYILHQKHSAFLTKGSEFDLKVLLCGVASICPPVWDNPSSPAAHELHRLDQFSPCISLTITLEHHLCSLTLSDKLYLSP